MSEPRHDIDELFHSGMEGHSDFPSENTWKNISAELDRKDEQLRRHNNRIKSYVGILTLLFVGILFYRIASFDTAADKHAKKQETPAGKDITGQQEDNLPASQKDRTAKTEQHQGSNMPLIENSDNHDVFIPKKSREEFFQDYITNEVVVESGELYELSDSQNEAVANGQNIGSLKTTDAEAGDEIYISRNKTLFSLTQVDKSRAKNITTHQIPATEDRARLPVFASSGKSVRQHSRFSITPYAAPGMVWYSVNANVADLQPPAGGNPGSGSNGGGASVGGGNMTSAAITQDYGQEKRHGFVYAGGINLFYKLSKRLSIGTGLSYLGTSASTSSKKVYAVQDNSGAVRYRLNASSGYSYFQPVGSSRPNAGDSTVITESRSSISYLSVPAIIDYKLFSAGKFSLSAMSGAQVNFLVKAKTFADFGRNNEASAKLHGLESIYLSVLTGINSEMVLNDKFSITVSPTAQFGLSYINKNWPVRTKPNYLGVAAGVKIKL